MRITKTGSLSFFALFLLLLTGSKARTENTGMIGAEFDQILTGKVTKDNKEGQPSAKKSLLSVALEVFADEELMQHYQEPKSVAGRALQVLGAYRRKEALPFLIDRLDIRIIVGWKSGPSTAEYPAYGAILKYGQEAIPVLVDVVSSETASELVRKNALSLLWQIGNMNNMTVIRLLKQQSDENPLKAMRLRQLAISIKDLTVLPSRGKNSEVPRSIVARMKAHGTSIELTEKLDAPSEDKTYPAVAALINIGEPALPAIADAIATRGRSELFRNNGLQAMLKILKTPGAVSATLSQFADENEKKAQRLREIAASLPKQN
jgi:hypothetical protein